MGVPLLPAAMTLRASKLVTLLTAVARLLIIFLVTGHVAHSNPPEKLI